MAIARVLRIPLLAFACCACLPTLAWKVAWQTVVDGGVEMASIKGVCMQRGIAYAAVVNATKIATDPVAALYAIGPLNGATPPQATLLWKGDNLRALDDLSEPICDSAGISFALRKQGSDSLEWVQIDFKGNPVNRRPVRMKERITKAKAFADGKVLLVGNESVFVMAPGGAASPAPIPEFEGEAILDACVLSGNQGLALLTMRIVPTADMRVHRFNANLAMTGSSTLPGGFGSLRCTGANEPIEVHFLQAQAGMGGNFARALVGPAPNQVTIDAGPEARIASMSAKGTQSKWGSIWAFNNYKMPHVFAWPPRAKPEMLWRDSDEKRGGTIQPPHVIALDSGLLVVHESVDRSSGKLPTVLRAVLLEP
jgi:hypothetical protein